MSAQKAGNVAYMFSHGEGKDRLGKDCNLRETFHWRTLFLSSGEKEFGEFKLDESYFGAKRISGKRERGAAGKTQVFGF